MKTFLTITGLFLNLAVHANTVETKTFDAKSIRKVDIDNSSGLVKVIGSDNSKATVTIEKVRFGDHCQLNLSQDGSKLKMDIERKNLGIGVECKANVTFNIPKNAEIEVQSGSGNVEVTGVTRSLDFTIGSGDINIDAQLEKLNGKSGSGYISFKGVVADVDLKAGSGDIKMIYEQPPQPGEVDIKTGSGNAALTLPGATELNSSTITATGSVQNEFAANRNAKFKVSFRSGSGNISIKKTGSSSTN